MIVRIGMIVTDIAHVGKYEIVEVTKSEVKLKRLSTSNVIAETDKDRGITVLPISLFEMSFVIFNETINSTQDMYQVEKKPFSYRDTPEYKKQEAAGKVLFEYLENMEDKYKGSNKSGCLGLLLLLVIVITSIII